MTADAAAGKFGALNQDAGHAYRTGQTTQARLYAQRNFGMVYPMSTVTAILEPDADGTVHVPVPAGLRQGKLKVTATFEAPEAPASVETIEERRLKIQAACRTLQELGTFKVIADPAEWQRDLRRDRPLPGRD